MVLVSFRSLRRYSLLYLYMVLCSVLLSNNGCGLFPCNPPVVASPSPLPPVADCEVSHPEGLEDFWVVELGDERD